MIHEIINSLCSKCNHRKRKSWGKEKKGKNEGDKKEVKRRLQNQRKKYFKKNKISRHAAFVNSTFAFL